MSSQRFTPEFKEEAVRQVVERGYGVPDVAARLGVSAHSLYKWVKAVSPDRSEQQSKELLEAKSEILRLRSQLRRTEEERDLLKKKPRGTLPGSPSEVPPHDRAPPRLSHYADVPGLAGGSGWVLRLAARTGAQEDARLLDLIRDSYSASHGVYGARRIFGDLREVGETCGLHRVERIMRKNGIQPVRGYKKPRTIAGRPSIIAPNRLRREFTVDAPNKVWVTDITYIRTWQGWLYLASWSISSRAESSAGR